MGIHLADQTMVFLHAMLTGALLALLFDAFRISRIAIPTPAPVVFVEDLLFWLFCAIITFAMMMSTLDGQVRFFVFVGEILGAVLYSLTLGRLVMKVSKAIIRVIKAILGFLWRYLLYPIWKILYWIVSLLLRPVYFLSRICKKKLQRLNFRLKVHRIVLYNQLTDCLGAVKSKSKRKTGARKTHDSEKEGT